MMWWVLFVLQVWYRSRVFVILYCFRLVIGFSFYGKCYCDLVIGVVVEVVGWGDFVLVLVFYGDWNFVQFDGVVDDEGDCWSFLVIDVFDQNGYLVWCVVWVFDCVQVFDCVVVFIWNLFIVKVEQGNQFGRDLLGDLGDCWYWELVGFVYVRYCFFLLFIWCVLSSCVCIFYIGIGRCLGWFCIWGSGFL